MAKSVSPSRSVESNGHVGDPVTSTQAIEHHVHIPEYLNNTPDPRLVTKIQTDPHTVRRSSAASCPIFAARAMETNAGDVSRYLHRVSPVRRKARSDSGHRSDTLSESATDSRGGPAGSRSCVSPSQKSRSGGGRRIQPFELRTPKGAPTRTRQLRKLVSPRQLSPGECIRVSCQKQPPASADIDYAIFQVDRHFVYRSPPRRNVTAEYRRYVARARMAAPPLIEGQAAYTRLLARQTPDSSGILDDDVPLIEAVDETNSTQREKVEERPYNHSMARLDGSVLAGNTRPKREALLGVLDSAPGGRNPRGHNTFVPSMRMSELDHLYTSERNKDGSAVDARGSMAAQEGSISAQTSSPSGAAGTIPTVSAVPGRDRRTGRTTTDLSPEALRPHRVVRGSRSPSLNISVRRRVAHAQQTREADLQHARFRGPMDWRYEQVKNQANGRRETAPQWYSTTCNVSVANGGSHVLSETSPVEQSAGSADATAEHVSGASTAASAPVQTQAAERMPATTGLVSAQRCPRVLGSVTPGSSTASRKTSATTGRHPMRAPAAGVGTK